MDAAKLRAWWFHRQGLDESMKGKSPAEVLEKTGWARSVGGVNPYLTLFSRAGTSKAEAEQAVVDIEIHELPSARGCTYVMSQRDYALALRMARGQGDPAEVATAQRHLGVTDAELENLRAKVIDVLDRPMDPKEIRDAVGDAVRSLGEEGKKRGQTTTLPLALGLLQTEGNIRRVPVAGRLDQQRYKYVRWEPSPMAGYVKSYEEAMSDFARLYFSWAGPARKAAFQGISGLGVKASEAATAHLNLQPIEGGSDLYLLPEDREAFEAFEDPHEPLYALTSNLDNLTHWRWGQVQDLVEESDRDREAPNEKGQILKLGGFRELESHAIYDRGRLVGLWEYDAEIGEIAWKSFAEPDAALREAVIRTEEFARTLGDIRSFSLDSPESRKPRIAALRAE